MVKRKKSKYWQRPFRPADHPYGDLEGTPIWRAVKRALEDMEENQDLALNEWHQYVVGYVCKQLVKKGVVNPAAVEKRRRRPSSKAQTGTPN